MFFARFFDVQILKDGEKIEPRAAVDIRVEYDEPLTVDEAQALNVVHFADSGVEVIPEVALGEAGNDITYQQDSFSVSGTIITGTPSTTTLAPDSKEDFHKYMVLANVDGEFYIILNDGKLLKVAEYDSSKNTFETDYPMMWKYRTDTVDGNTYYNLYHPAKAVGYNGNQLASDFYWRYMDPNEADALSEDNAGNCVLDLHLDANRWCPYVTQRFHGPQAAVVYDEANHLLKSKDHPEWFICVKNVNGNMWITGQNPESSAVEIYLANVTDERLNPRGAQRNSVNHIDISVEGKAAVKVPLAYGDYYYVEGGQVKKFTVSRNNPVTVSLQKTVDVTQEDVKHAIVTAYTLGPNGEHVPQDDMFIISGYSRNEHTEVDGQQLSTNQIRIEGIFKVADLRKLHISPDEMTAGGFDHDQCIDLIKNHYRQAARPRLINRRGVEATVTTADK